MASDELSSARTSVNSRFATSISAFVVFTPSIRSRHLDHWNLSGPDQFSKRPSRNADVVGSCLQVHQSRNKGELRRRLSTFGLLCRRAVSVFRHWSYIEANCSACLVDSS